MRGHLHQDEERQDGADRDRQPGEALEEERVAEEHQKHELSGAGAQQGATHAGHQAQVADDEEQADGGGRGERDVHGDVIDQIGEQQMEREERGRDEPVVHRMERRPGRRAHHHHHREEEQERHRGEERDARRERTRVQLLGKLHPDRLAGNHVRERPRQRPAVRRRRHLARRDGSGGEVDLPEIRPQRQVEVAHLRGAGPGKGVGPRAEPSGSVLDVQGDDRARRGIHDRRHLF